MAGFPISQRSQHSDLDHHQNLITILLSPQAQSVHNLLSYAWTFD